jgi:chromosomal replication initiator protein
MSLRRPSSDQHYHRLLSASRPAQEVLAFVSASIKQIVDQADESNTIHLHGCSPLELMEQARAEPRLSLVNFASALRSVDLPASFDAQGSATGLMGPKKNALIPGFTFETFVTGAANKLVVGASKEFVDLLSARPNSLFIAGAIGTGKTHLLHAIGNAACSRFPKTKVRYMTTGDFVSAVIDAYKARSFPAFRRHFETLDVLLLDDVDELINRERSQQELAAILDVMVAQGSSIVMAGHCQPKDLGRLQKRLLSRFSSSQVCRVEPPNLPTKVAILLRKALDAQMKFPVDVAIELADRLPGDVRALEGALHSILAFAKFHQRQIDVTLIDQAAGLLFASAADS